MILIVVTPQMNGCSKEGTLVKQFMQVTRVFSSSVTNKGTITCSIINWEHLCYILIKHRVNKANTLCIWFF